MMARLIKRFLLLVSLLVLIGLGLVMWANMAAVVAAEDRLYDRVEQVPEGRVGLVFGCDDEIAGRENLYFRYRIDAAAKLWKAGKLRCVIVSGDNRTKHYNEPEQMRRALVKAGVPEGFIVSDYAGLRTLDSVVRAKEIFGVEEVTFITQEFQNERALYLAQAHGLDAIGYNAEDVDGSSGWRTKFREIGARVKMWLDVRVLGTEPRYLGGQEELPG